jgi:hypothetical protein
MKTQADLLRKIYSSYECTDSQDCKIALDTMKNFQKIYYTIPFGIRWYQRQNSLLKKLEYFKSKGK